jgi:hypothetical protein
MGDGGAKSEETREGHPTPGYLPKSLDLLDSKGVDFFESDKEFVRVSE